MTAESIRYLLVALVGSVLFTSASPAQDGTFVKNANRAYEVYPASRRSDMVLLPVLAAMTAPPARVAYLEDASLLPATSVDFPAAAEWAQAPAQRAALEALDQVTRETDWTKAYAFAQPYGADAVEPAMVRAGQYSEVGDPPMLAAVQHLFLPRLDRLACLVNVEATRRAAAGEVAQACDVLVDWVFFGRQMADRVMGREAAWGLRAMNQGLERLRDVVYLDMTAGRRLTAQDLRALLERLAETGYTDVGRIGFPPGDRIAAEQVLARVYPGHTVDEAVFAPTMARLGSAAHPLRLFSEWSRWRTAAAAQSDAPTARRLLTGLFDDWRARWQAGWYDLRQNVTPAYTLLPKESNAAIAQSVPDLGELIELRQIARTELVGTRTTLALIGHLYTHGSMATQLSVVRPQWLPTIESDPFNPERLSGPKAWMNYLVPMRDTPKNSRGEPVPYEVSVVTNDPTKPVNRRLTDETFMVLSMGANGKFEYGILNQNTAKRLDTPADYLIFPPVVSLQRQVLVDGQLLK
jgi:hypothetical protein